MKEALAATNRDRAVWHEQLAAEPVAALLFVDESGANTKMTRLRGRALGGERLLARIPHGYSQTSTLIAGLRLEGPCTPWLFGGPTNGEMLVAWVREGLAPPLRPGDMVDEDRAGIQGHRVWQVVPMEIWMKPLADGSKAVAMFNREKHEMMMTSNFKDIGITSSAKLRALWAHKDLGNLNGSYTTNVIGHGVVMLKVEQ